MSGIPIVLVCCQGFGITFACSGSVRGIGLAIVDACCWYDRTSAVLLFQRALSVAYGRSINLPPGGVHTSIRSSGICTIFKVGAVSSRSGSCTAFILAYSHPVRTLPGGQVMTGNKAKGVYLNSYSLCTICIPVQRRNVSKLFCQSLAQRHLGLVSNKPLSTFSVCIGIACITIL